LAGIAEGFKAEIPAPSADDKATFAVGLQMAADAIGQKHGLSRAQMTDIANRYYDKMLKKRGA
jgi:hypothetical protein